MSQLFSSMFGGLRRAMTGPSGGVDWGKIFNLGTGTLGLISNISSNRQKNKLINEYLARQRYLQSLTPEQHMAGIRRFQQPLSAGLTSGVENLVQASMAERGLSQAPGIFSQVLSQALAPYLLRQQDSAQDAYFRSLGVGGDSSGLLNAAGLYTPSNTTNIWRDLLSRFRPSATTPPFFPFALSGLEPSSPDPGGLVYSRPTGAWWELFGGSAGTPSLEDFYAENPG